MSEFKYSNIPPELVEQIEQRYPSEQDGHTPEQIAWLTEHPAVFFDAQSAIQTTAEGIAIVTAVVGLANATRAQREETKLKVSENFDTAISDLEKPETRLKGINTLRSYLRDKREDYYEQIFMSTVHKFCERDLENTDPNYQLLYSALGGIFKQCVPLLRKKLGIERLAKRAATDHTETEEHKSKYADTRTDFFNASGCKFNGLNFERADLSYLLLEHASFDPLVGNGPPIDPENDEDPRRTKLYRVNFRGADLNGASLKGAYAVKADFRGARLRNVDVTGAKLNFSEFGPNCERTDLTKALKLKGANVENISSYPEGKFPALLARIAEDNKPEEDS